MLRLEEIFEEKENQQGTWDRAEYLKSGGSLLRKVTSEMRGLWFLGQQRRA